MAMTKLEMVTEVCNTVGKSLDALSRSGETLKDRVGRYVNWAQRRMAMYTNFWELSTLHSTAATVADIYTYPLTSGTNNLGLSRVKSIASIRLIDGENSRKLERKGARHLDKYIPRFENYTTDRPSMYIRKGTTLYMFRVPNDAYDLIIMYNQWASDLSTDSSTSDFDNKDDIIIATTVFETYLALQEHQSAADWRKIALEKLQNITKAEDDLADADLAFLPFQDTPSYSGIGTPWTSPWNDSLYGYE